MSFGLFTPILTNFLELFWTVAWWLSYNLLWNDLILPTPGISELLLFYLIFSSYSPPPPLSTRMKTFNQKPFFWNTALHKKGLSFRNLKKGLGKINCFKKGGITYFHSHYPFPVLSFSECFACVWVLCLFAPFYQIICFAGRT